MQVLARVLSAECLLSSVLEQRYCFMCRFSYAGAEGVVFRPYFPAPVRHYSCVLGERVLLHVVGERGGVIVHHWKGEGVCSLLSFGVGYRRLPSSTRDLLCEGSVERRERKTRVTGWVVA